MCVAEIAIPEAGSLKDKRRVVRSLKDQIRNKFNVSIAEVAANEIYTLAVLGMASVSNEARYLEGQMSHLEEILEKISGGMLSWFEYTIEQHGEDSE